MRDIIFLFLCLTSLSMIISRPIHVAANGIISFFFMAESYSIVYMNHIFFIHSSVNGHLGCFHVLVIVNSAAVNTGVHVFFRTGFLWLHAQKCDCWFIWQFYFQFFKEPLYCSPQWLYQFTFPPTVLEGSLFSTFSPAFTVCRHFDDRKLVNQSPACWCIIRA